MFEAEFFNTCRWSQNLRVDTCDGHRGKVNPMSMHVECMVSTPKQCVRYAVQT